MLLYIRGGGSLQSNRSAMWDFIVNSMQCHILMHMVATCFNIGGVEKLGFATWVWTFSYVALAK
jgi:hypothetical protein